MSDYLTNQLFFPTNAKTILNHLKSKPSDEESPESFSLNSIKQMPSALLLPLNPQIRDLSLMNVEMPPFDDVTKQVALSTLFAAGDGKRQSGESILQKISELDKSMANSPPTSRTQQMERDLLKQAIANYRKYSFFSQYDWRLTHWGTVKDIHSIAAETFVPTTNFIEFETFLTPPINALQLLANAFPSVRFKLQYRYSPDDAWISDEIFPNPPFGY